MPEPLRLRWSRADSVVTRVLLVLAIAGTGLVGLFGLVWITPLLPAGDEAIAANTITVARPDGVPEPRMDAATSGQDVTVSDTGRMVIEFHDPTTLERFLLVAPGLLAVVAALVVMVAVHRMVRSLDRGEPFVTANVRRVFVIALTVVIGSMVVPMVAAVCENALRARALESDEIAFSFVVFGEGGISPALLFTGFLLAALAEVFRRGARLRADVEGLV
ncbi:DUF2975 domain-containing protein [Nocardiopsis sp. NRRL B-16309]|uniref:DUF2975 domain-containing protein n=1 Tax=Nocardiopsis sp. NRRL B-16309 TaxID=1519494 RepID=UPI0006AEBB48|nr:DUF2975 domain-containing protein [Nocardiopsis sp. NRRL B-16309]KOX23626.1 hypothetical protein ADL05_02620 [Nocardiopsis sp. NRRL B-16309]